jgi:uracil-DNA glycosylase
MTAAIEDLKDILEYFAALGYEDLPIAVDTGRVAQGAPAYQARKPVRGADCSCPDRGAALEALRDEIGDCQRCKLSKRRTKIVFGTGDPASRLMFIGEAPGREEDLQGLPFVGDAGTLLTRLIAKMGFKREDVYIANIIKCRPPMNRDPEEDEIATCRGFIERQIEIVRPEVIMTLGRIALQALMDSPKLRISAARGRFLDFNGIPVMPTFHPAYLLRNPKDKLLTWSDAQKVMARLGLSHA